MKGHDPAEEGLAQGGEAADRPAGQEAVPKGPAGPVRGAEDEARSHEGQVHELPNMRTVEAPQPRGEPAERDRPKGGPRRARPSRGEDERQGQGGRDRLRIKEGQGESAEEGEGVHGDAPSLREGEALHPAREGGQSGAQGKRLADADRQAPVEVESAARAIAPAAREEDEEIDLGRPSGPGGRSGPHLHGYDLAEGPAVPGAPDPLPPPEGLRQAGGGRGDEDRDRHPPFPGAEGDRQNRHHRSHGDGGRHQEKSEIDRPDPAGLPRPSQTQNATRPGNLFVRIVRDQYSAFRERAVAPRKVYHSDREAASRVLGPTFAGRMWFSKVCTCPRTSCRSTYIMPLGYATRS